MPELLIHDFLNRASQAPVIDVRSPGEYSRGHIPGAVNLPLFTTGERAIVGTIYKQTGRDEAILKGLEIVGPKMAAMVKQARYIAIDNQVLVHCWRGGMRSGSVAWLLNTAGIAASTLKGGYKAYRKHILSVFNQPLKLILLGGETGSGKTPYLQALRRRGEQVIDLEALASHKGSSFGAIGEPEQPTDEHFLNLLAAEWMKVDPEKVLWLEDESHRIGAIRLPEELWKQMKEAPMLRVIVPKEVRIQNLVSMYGSLDHRKLAEGILRIQKRLGGLDAKEALLALDNGDLSTTADILLRYYDKSYVNLLSRKDNTSITTLPLSGTNIDQDVKCMLEAFQRILENRRNNDSN